MSRFFFFFSLFSPLPNPPFFFFSFFLSFSFFSSFSSFSSFGGLRSFGGRKRTDGIGWDRGGLVREGGREGVDGVLERINCRGGEGGEDSRERVVHNIFEIYQYKINIHDPPFFSFSFFQVFLCS